MSDRLNRVVGRAVIATPADPFALESGVTLTSAALAYETYGTLSRDGTNVVLICHALTGSAHAAGRNARGELGWWDALIGPRRAIDTDRWFVVCANVVGSCYGSTGPRSIDPARGEPYGSAFPRLTIRDIVGATRRLIDRLGVRRLHAAVGGSMGGMQVLEWALMNPGFVERIAPIATCAQHTPWAIGFSSIAREAIELGRRVGDVEAGLALARKVAMMSYRSEVEFAERFGREPAADDTEVFAVEQYLRRHGEKLVARFDDATYLTLSRAMMSHDVARGRGDVAAVLGSITARTLCIGISTDRLYPASLQRSLAGLIPGAHYVEIDSPCGHDAFLIENDQVGAAVARLLNEPSSPRASAGQVREEVAA